MDRMTRAWTFLLLALLATSAAAQEETYIQVEAQPSLNEGIAAAESYAARFEAVAGFRLPGSWYAIALGPYAPEDADVRLRQLRFVGSIPQDSYTVSRQDYGTRFYPPDGAIVETPAPLTIPDAGAADETPAQARRAERLLSREERALVQTALSDAGAYVGPIDAAFGPGTRRAMSSWQSANGYEPTGVLTTAQRTLLMERYRAVFEGLGMERTRDRAAGIEIMMPSELVGRAGEESPFVRYEPTGDLPVRVLLISQPGDRTTLAALFEIMQTLEVVPLQGPRVRRPVSFDLEGRNDEFVSTTYAEVLEGEIKGFTLVWPTGDERRRTRVLDEMRATFRRLPGTLPEPAGATTAAPDILSGLEVRLPARDRSGVFVDDSGSVLTTSEAVRSCRRVTLDGEIEVDVAATDEGLGLALLRPRSSLSPIRYARFSNTLPQLESEVAVAGYPFGGLLSAPSLNYGRLADSRGLSGDSSRSRLDLVSEPGEIGGPVFDTHGSVVGILVPHDGGSRRLPDGVSFATSPNSIEGFLAAAGLSPEEAQRSDQVPPEELTRMAADMTVLVRCWN
jgi:peptidoglycan hydrolase-like protein with peptidoglycan-binding domain